MEYALAILCLASFLLSILVFSGVDLIISGLFDFLVQVDRPILVCVYASMITQTDFRDYALLILSMIHFLSLESSLLIVA